MTSPNPTLHTAHTIKSMYGTIKHNQFKLLPEHFSNLIHIFASLSLLASAQIFTTSYRFGKEYKLNHIAELISASAAEAKTQRTHWSIVFQFLKDKKAQGHPLSNSDLYWLMRCCLQRVHEVSREQPSDRDQQIEYFVSSATKHYYEIRSHVPNWPVHVHFIEGLVNTGREEDLNKALRLSAMLLARFKGLHPNLVDVVLSTISIHAKVMSETTKHRFLTGLRSKTLSSARVLQFHERNSNNPRIISDESMLLGLVSKSKGGASIIMNDIIQLLLEYPRPLSLLACGNPDADTWLRLIVRSALPILDSSSEELNAGEDASWSNFFLLSVPHGIKRGSLVSGGAAKPEMARSGQITDWTLICALSTLEELLFPEGAVVASHNQGVDIPEDIQQHIKTLWVLWRRDIGNFPRPALVSSLIAITFMRFGVSINSTRLSEDISRYIVEDIILQSYLSETPIDASSIYVLVVEWIIMTNSLKIGNWSTIFQELEAMRLDIATKFDHRWKNKIVNIVIGQLSNRNISLAHRLYVLVERTVFTLDDGTLLVLGRSCIPSGYLSSTLRIIESQTLSQTSRDKLTNATFNHLFDIRVQYFDSEVGDILVRLLPRIGKTVSLPLSSDAYQWVLLIMVKSNYWSSAVEAVKAVLSIQATYFSASFLRSFAATLPSVRNTRMKFWKYLQAAKVVYASNLRGQRHQVSIPLELDEKGATLFSYRSPGYLIRLGHHLKHMPISRSSHARQLAIRLLKLYHRLPHKESSSFEPLLKLFLRAGRTQAAIRHWRKNFPDLEFPTWAGNFVIDNEVRRSAKGRRVERATKRMQILMKETNFVPDHVSLNILIKARLDDLQPLDLSYLRALFNELISKGYPNGSSSFSLDAKTRQVPFETVSGAPDLISLPFKQTSLKLERHIRPLYLTFIKAFSRLGDTVAAETVKSILQTVTLNVMDQRRIQEQARRNGLKALRKDEHSGLSS